MSNIQDRVREQNAAWWAAHPDLRKNWTDPVDPIATGKPIGPPDAQMPRRGTAASLARSVVHWQHNYESSLRHGTRTGDGTGPMAPVDAHFGRRYAILATKAMLIEAQTALETYPPDHAFWVGYGHRDQEAYIRNLQIALDDFEWNDKHPSSIAPGGA